MPVWQILPERRCVMNGFFSSHDMLLDMLLLDKEQRTRRKCHDRSEHPAHKPEAVRILVRLLGLSISGTKFPVAHGAVRLENGLARKGPRRSNALARRPSAYCMIGHSFGLFCYVRLQHVSIYIYVQSAHHICRIRRTSLRYPHLASTSKPSYVPLTNLRGPSCAMSIPRREKGKTNVGIDADYPRTLIR